MTPYHLIHFGCLLAGCELYYIVFWSVKKVLTFLCSVTQKHKVWSILMFKEDWHSNFYTVLRNKNSYNCFERNYVWIKTNVIAIEMFWLLKYKHSLHVWIIPLMIPFKLWIGEWNNIIIAEACEQSRCNSGNVTKQLLWWRIKNEECHHPKIWNLYMVSIPTRVAGLCLPIDY